MKPGKRARTLGVAMVLLGTLAACDSDHRLHGEYGQYESEIWFPILDFGLGGKVTLKMSGSSDDYTGTYQRNGDKVIVNVAGEVRTLTIDTNGCLDGGKGNSFFSGVICKER